jgi:hypothetical protein
MAEKIPQGVADLLTVYKTLLLDLPLAGGKWGLGIGKEKEVAEAAWKGYDAGVRAATAAIDTLYRTPLFGRVLGRSFTGMLRWPRLGKALSGALFTGLWRTVGLPTAAEAQALQSEIQALHEELRSLTAHLPTLSRESEIPSESAAGVVATMALVARVAELEAKLNERRTATATG